MQTGLINSGTVMGAPLPNGYPGSTRNPRGYQFGGFGGAANDNSPWPFGPGSNDNRPGGAGRPGSSPDRPRPNPLGGRVPFSAYGALNAMLIPMTWSLTDGVMQPVGTPSTYFPGYVEVYRCADYSLYQHGCQYHRGDPVCGFHRFTSAACIAQSSINYDYGFSSNGEPYFDGLLWRHHIRAHYAPLSTPASAPIEIPFRHPVPIPYVLPWVPALNPNAMPVSVPEGIPWSLPFHALPLRHGLNPDAVEDFELGPAGGRRVGRNPIAGGVAVSAGGLATIPPSPGGKPPRDIRERKYRFNGKTVAGAASAVLMMLNAIDEVDDLLEILHAGVPEIFKGKGKKGEGRVAKWERQLREIYEHAGELDMDRVLSALAENFLSEKGSSLRGALQMGPIAPDESITDWIGGLVERGGLTTERPTI